MTEPQLTVFICRNALPPTQEEMPLGTSMVELPCSGRIDEVTILRAMRQGAWDVVVVGCLEGNCKHHSGCYQARRRVEAVRSILGQLNVDPERVRMVNIAPNQQAKLRSTVREARERAIRAGPIRILEGDK